MPLGSTTVGEAKRQLTVCNACRYCEGYCAVFRALGRRSVLTDGDIAYVANLCHDCRGCYQACMFTPPHEFAINIPHALSAMRIETYKRYAWPARLSGVFERSTWATGLGAFVGLVLMLAVALMAGDPARLMRADTEAGSFYRVVPHMPMLIPSIFLSGWAFLVFVVGGSRFVRDLSRDSAGQVPSGWWLALRDALTLRWMTGGGGGCYYPGHERPSEIRRSLHTLTVGGFFLALASTTVAAAYQELLGLLPPFEYTSAPVILGSLGGIAMIIGTTGLLVLKATAPRALIADPMRSIDLWFLIALDASSMTGMMLLALRSTSLLAIALLLHLTALAALYVTAPYGKLAHAVYRLLAVLQNQFEISSENARRSASAERI